MFVLFNGPRRSGREIVGPQPGGPMTDREPGGAVVGVTRCRIRRKWDSHRGSHDELAAARPP
jgi:hypothetical protein